MKAVISGIFFALCVSCFGGFGRNCSAFDEERDFSADIREVGGGLEAIIDLGLLPAGETIKASLELRNPFPFDLPIKEMKTTCSCIRVASRTSTIPTDGSVKLDLAYSIPRDARSTEYISVFMIHYADDASISVYLKCRIAGMVSFQNAMHFHSRVPIGQSNHEFKVPVFVTEPAIISNVKVTSESLGRLKATLSEDKKTGEQWLNCALPLGGDFQSMLGAIRMEEPKLGKQAMVQVVIEASPEVAIAPRLLRFVVDESNLASANALVKIDKSLLRLDEGQLEEMPVSINFSRNGLRLVTSSKRIATGVYRVKVSCEDEIDEDIRADFGELACTVNTGKSVVTSDGIKAIIE